MYSCCTGELYISLPSHESILSCTSRYIKPKYKVGLCIPAVLGSCTFLFLFTRAYSLVLQGTFNLNTRCTWILYTKASFKVLQEYCYVVLFLFSSYKCRLNDCNICKILWLVFFTKVIYWCFNFLIFRPSPRWSETS